MEAVVQQAKVSDRWESTLAAHKITLSLRMVKKILELKFVAYKHFYVSYKVVVTW